MIIKLQSPITAPNFILQISVGAIALPAAVLQICCQAQVEMGHKNIRTLDTSENISVYRPNLLPFRSTLNTKHLWSYLSGLKSLKLFNYFSNDKPCIILQGLSYGPAATTEYFNYKNSKAICTAFKVAILKTCYDFQ